MFEGSRGALKVPGGALEAARRYVEQLRGKLGGRLKLAVLYGSYVRGDFRDGSDLDLLLVIEGLPPRPQDRLEGLIEVLEGFYVEPHPLTPQEFLEAASQCRLVAYEALREGLLLYAEQAFYEQASEKLRRAEERFKPKRTARGLWLQVG